MSIYEPVGSIEAAILNQALIRNGVLNYAKCFSEAGKNRTKLNAKDIFKDTPCFLLSHESVMNLRNKYYAHSEDFGVDQAHIATKENPEEIYIKTLYTLKTSIADIERMIKLFDFLGSKVIAKIDKCYIRIKSDIGKDLRF